MKRKISELDVDFIGGQVPLTKKEEDAISMFIRAGKEKTLKQKARKRKLQSRSKKAIV